MITIILFSRRLLVKLRSFVTTRYYKQDFNKFTKKFIARKQKFDVHHLSLLYTAYDVSFIPGRLKTCLHENICADRIKKSLEALYKGPLLLFDLFGQ